MTNGHSEKERSSHKSEHRDKEKSKHKDKHRDKDRHSSSNKVSTGSYRSALILKISINPYTGKAPQQL